MALDPIPCTSHPGNSKTIGNDRTVTKKLNCHINVMTVVTDTQNLLNLARAMSR